MAKTRHIQKRMSQRGINQELIELVKQFGAISGEKHILNKKACDAAVAELDAVRKKLIRAKDKGGIVVISQDDTDITTYRVNSYRRSIH